MPKIPIVSAKQLTKALRKIGFEVVSQKGSHIKLLGPNNKIAIVPSHSQIKKGTIKKGILSPLDISVEKLIKLLK
jgi:predicted RNA binding protein YcfA (HicA-like mRNA interferase family)